MKYFAAIKNITQRIRLCLSSFRRKPPTILTKEHHLYLEELFDKRVPLALVLALAMQIGAAVWWAAAKDSDDHFAQMRLTELEQIANDMRKDQLMILERLARIEERVNAQNQPMRHSNPIEKENL